MSSEERLEATVDELWYAADAFVGEDESLRPLLGKLGDSIPRLWTAIDKGNPHRVALAAMAVCRRFEDIFQPLRKVEAEDLATRLQREDEGPANARIARSVQTKQRHQAIRDAVNKRLLAHPRDSIAYAAQCIFNAHKDENGNPSPGWSETTIKRATKGMRHPSPSQKKRHK